MAHVNFFDNSYFQVHALSAWIMDRIRKDTLDTARTDDLVREAVAALRTQGVDMEHYVTANGHSVYFPNTRGGGRTPHTSMLIDTRRYDDGTVSYRVTLDMMWEDTAHFPSVDTFMPVFTAVAYCAKTHPDRPVYWDVLKIQADDIGHYLPIGPWVEDADNKEGH